MTNPSVKTNTLGFLKDITIPAIKLPAGACDSHMHIVGPQERYLFTAVRSLSPPEGSWQDYRVTAGKLGLDRSVIVQPSFYGTDNRCTLDAVAESDGRARAVVVVDGDVTEQTIAAMHESGARGVRVQMVSKGGVSFEAIESIAARIAPFGWHLQLYLDATELPALITRLRRLPTPLVFDHMAHVIEASGTQDKGFRLLLDLLASGKGWVELSNALFPPSAERAQIFAKTNPKRILWGSDWPHVAHSDAGVPDDGQLVNLLADWIPDEATRHKALVDNPGELYFAQK